MVQILIYSKSPLKKPAPAPSVANIVAPGIPKILPIFPPHIAPAAPPTIEFLHASLNLECGEKVIHL